MRASIALPPSDPKLIAELEAQAAGPTNRAEFCDMVLETAGDILWQEQMEFEAAATEAMHDVYGD